MALLKTAEATTKKENKNRLPADRRDQKPKQGDPLSRGETNVVRLVAQGLSNEEIATALRVSVRCVKFRISRAFRKSGARDRVALLLWSQAHGLAPKGPESQILSSAERESRDVIALALDLAAAVAHARDQLERTLGSVKTIANEDECPKKITS